MVGPTMSPATANRGSRWWLVTMVGARGPNGWSQPAAVCHRLHSRPHGLLFRVGVGVPGTLTRTRDGGCCPAVPVLSTQHAAPTGLSTKRARPRSRKDYTCPGRPDHDISTTWSRPCECGSFGPGRRERIDLPFGFWSLVDTGVPDRHLGADERLGEALSRPRLRPRRWSPDRRRCGRRRGRHGSQAGPDIEPGGAGAPSSVPHHDHHDTQQGAGQPGASGHQLLADWSAVAWSAGREPTGVAPV